MARVYLTPSEDQARLRRLLRIPDGLEEDNYVAGSRHDWHTQRHEGEPICQLGMWRTRDRMKVLYVEELSDQHLAHCIRFARTKSQHALKLGELVEELNRRAMDKVLEKEAPWLTFTISGSIE